MSIFDIIKSGDAAQVRELLKQKENLEIRDERGNTPLMFAAWHNKSEIVDFLLKLGANPKAENTYKYTALHLAVSQAHHDIDMVNRLLDSGIDIMARDDSQNTVLHIAARAGNLGAVKSILKHPSTNADLLDATDNQGWNAITKAIRAHINSVEILEVLLANNASILLENINYATYFGYIDAIKVMCKYNKDLLDVKDEFGRTSLHYAYLGQAHDVAPIGMPSVLRDYGAHDLLDNKGHLPYELQVLMGYE